MGGSVAGSTINSGISLLATGTVGFSGNTINQNNALPIKAYADHVGGIVSGSTITNVDASSYLEVSADTIERDAVWTAAMPYAITGNIIVQGADGDDGITTLTIEPGATLKFNSSRYMTIGATSGDPGALIARGTSENMILFTSNQTIPAAGDWGCIRFYSTTAAAATLMAYCVVDYGGAGNLRTITYPTGQTVAYQPDAADPARIGGVSLDSQTLAAGLTYKPYGPVSALTLGNGIAVAKTYDPNYQLLTISDTVLDRTYLPDNVGNIELITDNLDASRSQSFD